MYTKSASPLAVAPVPTDLVSGRLYPAPVNVAVKPEDIARIQQPTMMLVAISNTGKHLYQGTVPAHVKARRRAANKVARHARRAAR